MAVFVKMTYCLSGIPSFFPQKTHKKNISGFGTEDALYRSIRKREKQMISKILEMHGKKFKVFLVDSTKNDGKNRKLLGSFKTSEDAIRFMNRYPS